MTSEPGIFALSVLLRMEGPLLYWLSCAPQVNRAVSQLLVVAPKNWPHVEPSVKSTPQVREFTFCGPDVMELACHVRDTGFGKRAPKGEALSIHADSVYD